MHLVLIAWLYVIAMMAVTASSFIGGLALFVTAGVAPVLALVAWRVRQLRRARAEASGSRLEQVVHDRDDADSKADQ